MSEGPVSDPSAVLPQRKQYLSPEEYEELWELRGFKFRVDELHQAMLSNGLLPSINQDSFRDMMYRMVRDFLVDGAVRRDPRHAPRPLFPKVF